MSGLSRPAGFVLIDVVLALALLALTLTGAAQLIVLGATTAMAARGGALASALAADKVEQLQALAWSYDAEGREVTDLTSDVSVIPAAGGGSGLRPSPPGSLEANMAGYVDHLDGTGQWVGNTTERPSQARFTRRWSVQPLPESPGDAVLLQVVVFEAAAVAGLSADGSADAGEVWHHLATFRGAHLTLLRTRRGR